MAVLHFTDKGTILCGTKAKTLKSTEVKENVTCKRCLKKLGIVGATVEKKAPAKRKESKITAEIKGRFVMLISKDFMIRFDMAPSDHFMFCTTTGTCFTSSALCGSQIKKSMKNKDRLEMIAILAELKDEDGKISGRDVLERFK